MNDYIGKTIEFKTGRNYGIDQVLEIHITDANIDNFGFVTFLATFTDKARGI